MIRRAPRLFLRSSLPIRSLPACRRLSTVPPPSKPRSLKNNFARWGLLLGAFYWFNTSDVFAEEPPLSSIPPPQNPTDETSLQTLESLSPRNRNPSPPSPDESSGRSDVLTPASPDLEATEGEASQEGAFNEETGEINWDCPCLGGMAHGPCGEQFRAAFSCFVYSKEEPKGMDCIDNFKTMQDCFRQHPEIYGAELEDDEVAAVAPEGAEGAVAAAPESSDSDVPSSVTSVSSPAVVAPSEAAYDTARRTPGREHTETIRTTEASGESEDLMPRDAHDATSANEGK